MSMTKFQVELTSARSWTDEKMEALFAEGFPVFISGDKEVPKYIERVRASFQEYDLILTNEDDQLVATGWGVPIIWSGEVSELPSSFADVLRQSIDVLEGSSTADTFVICGAVVHPSFKGGEAAESLIRALCDTAAAHHLANVIAPVRPTRKHLYPLLGIDAYAAWVRDDGMPWDPWLRLHVRIGGKVIGLAREAQTMTDAVSQWEEWTGLEIPVSGNYIIPKGMAPLHIDKIDDLGTYVEPNVWVRHR
jgi:hypothetical protein